MTALVLLFITINEIKVIRKIDKLRRNCKYCKLLFLKDTLLKYILIRFDDHLPPLISITDERFPPAWLQPLPPLRSVQGLQLMLFRQESSSSIPINWYVLLINLRYLRIE
ncbi:hypothetical protein J5S49_18665 [Virgibacillus halodenitrificans]|uniref:Uncharacterized protein n=1 Tax=Virgibacillus halodenitrificans TaxID=1482 RepID=A0ABR7VJZ2_VIRHA|nr:MULTISPECIES: hypothetical protein [Virgibacillus]AIF45048.1 hypothetical protein X953_00275 [Virgibacillus sp. SK37]MBD1222254.1 hypothetical protein [Virgibacillus halodenitrificans]MCG1030312.1 hypothetical protein [Virgibacillus halodenitrificans]CDQ32021.1 hypothetical protein BN993_01416 [Virgibacillus halodenitrificans]